MTRDYQDLNDYRWLMAEVLRHETEQAWALGRLILDKFGKKSVIDIGCGPGVYLLPFVEAGCKVLGIDGCPAGGECLVPEEFEVVDLREPWTPTQKFDLALCIEVGEHIEFKYHGNILKAIAESAPLCFFSAAHPGQGGENHVAEADFGYWQGMFNKFGFVFDQGLTDTIQGGLSSDPVYEHCGWLLLHSWIFRKP